MTTRSHHRRDRCACGAEKMAKAALCLACRRAAQQRQGRKPRDRSAEYDLCACGRRKARAARMCQLCANRRARAARPAGPPRLSARAAAALDCARLTQDDAARLAFLQERARDWRIGR